MFKKLYEEIIEKSFKKIHENVYFNKKIKYLT